MNSPSSNVEFWGLEVPQEYPVAEHVLYIEKGRELIATNQEAWIEFSRGIKATAYRFVAFKELLSHMDEKWEALELYPDHRDIFEQERDLLSLFVFGVSAIEGAYYSLYILATQANPSVLDFEDLDERKRGSDPKWIRSRIKSALGNVPVVTAIRAIERSQNWREWTRYRNQMFHSVASPRVHRLSVDPNPPKPDILDYGATWSTPELLKNTASFQKYLPWLSAKLGRLMKDAAKIEPVA